MMKKNQGMRIICGFFAGFILMVSLLGCSSPDPSPTPSTTPTPTAASLLDWLTDELGACLYTVVRSDLANNTVTQGSTQVKKALEEALQTDVTIQTDVLARGESVPEEAYEILVGETNRSASKTALEALEPNAWSVDVQEHKIVIIGNGTQATLAAVNAFCAALQEEKTLQTALPMQGVYVKESESENAVKNTVKNPVVPVSPIRASRLLRVRAQSGSAGLTLATMQGIVARTCSTQILIKSGAVDLYLPYIQEAGVSVADQDEEGNAWTLESLLLYYAEYMKGYILCSSSLDSESASVAVSLAGLMDAVVVTSSEVKTAQKAGLTMLLDVTDKDDAWLRSSAYFSEFRTDVAVEQSPSMAPKLMDYVTMAQCYCYFYNGHNADEHENRFAFLNPEATVIGWNNTLGEYDTVRSLSRLSVQLIPADHAVNLSTLAGFSLQSIKQTGAQADDSLPEQKHTVCFILSDGDNLQWALNDYTSNRWYGSPLRGSFPMGWGLPASIADLASPMLQYFYNNATDQDTFLLQLSGVGYTFPSLWESDARYSMACTVSDVMKRMDMKYMEILDTNAWSLDTLYAFAEQDGIEGIFYIDYSDYGGERGKILWYDDTPIVSARYCLWSGNDRYSIERVASNLNAASKDPMSADGYSFVIVHAWSGIDNNGNFVGSGSSMEAVKKCIGLLSDDVDVVDVNTFMARVRDLVQH